MKAPQVCRLADVLLWPRECEKIDGDLVSRVNIQKSTSLLRSRLEKRSSSTFIGELQGQLSRLGIAPDEVAGHLIAVINAPTVMLSRRVESGSEILQAVAVYQRNRGPADSVLMMIRATVSASKPPEVIKVSVDVNPASLVAIADQCAIGEMLEVWSSEFGVRESVQSVAHAPKSWAWLGSPLNCGYLDVPKDWEARLRTLGYVLGMRSFVTPSPTQARAQAVHQQAQLYVMPHGANGWEDIVKLLDTPGVDLLSIGRSGTQFNELLKTARDELVPYVLRPKVGDPFASRELMPGEIVYHRKEKGGRHFDYFDKGSQKACVHNRFGPWSGDKAQKGMARRYSNFYSSDVQLLHCRFGMNCGMYAVTRSG